MHSFYLGYCAHQLSLLFSFFTLAYFFKYVICFFRCQGHLKQFLENYRFCQKSGNHAYSWAFEGSCYLCHCDALCTTTDMDYHNVTAFEVDDMLEIQKVKHLKSRAWLFHEIKEILQIVVIKYLKVIIF